MRASIALVTDAAHPDLSADDQVLQRAMGGAGLEGVPVPWDAEPDWATYGAVVVRSTWDYHQRHDEFLQWLLRLEQAGVPVFNPVPVLRWNSDKRYLRDLERAGIPIVQTEWLARGAVASLGDVCRRRGWRDVVVKPAVSASAFETWRVSGTPGAEDDAGLARLLASRDVLVQPFVREIEEEGEYSLIYFSGEFSHAVLKRPGPGDFRVQEALGGSSAPVRVAPGLIEAGKRAVSAAPAASLYARADGCVVEGRFLLMELEAVEPSLFLLHDVRAAGRFTAALQRELAAIR